MVSDDCRDLPGHTLRMSEPEQPNPTHQQLQAEINDLKTKVEELTEMVQELVAIWRAASGFVTVMGWIGKTIKWTAGIGGALFGLYMLLSGHGGGGKGGG